MRCSFDGEIGAGSAPERSTSSSLRASSSCDSVSPEPSVICACPPAILRLDDGRGLDLAVEDDGEAALDVGAGDLLEAVAARRGERERRRTTRRARCPLIRRGLRVAQHVAGDLGLAEEVVGAPADLGLLAACPGRSRRRSP